MTIRRVSTILCAAAVASLAALSAEAGAARAAPEPARLGPVKSYLLTHTAQLTSFTRELQAIANRYYARAKRDGFRPAALATDATVRRDLVRAKAIWVQGNPLYERVEGIVAGTPSLAAYDVILDAGSSAAEDPASAVPFDLKLPNGKVLRKPGNLYNLTEGMLWGTLPALVSGKPDLDGDGKGRVRRGDARRERILCRRDACDFQTSTSSTPPRALAADPAGRVHRARRDDPDDVRVLRGSGRTPRFVARRQGDPRGVRRRLAPPGHRRHPRRPPT